MGPPRSTGSFYHNYKGGNSIVLLALVDANYKFLCIDVGCNGRVSDGGVYRNSELSQAVSANNLNFPTPSLLPGTTTQVPYVIIADDAFPLQRHIMKPYKSRDINLGQKIFNYRLSRARRTVENAFGILSNRFRILLKRIELPVEKVEKIELSTCVLHNFLLSECNVYSANSEEAEGTQNGLGREEEWKEVVEIGPRMRAKR
jgi:hypothetical protein